MEKDLNALRKRRLAASDFSLVVRSQASSLAARHRNIVVKAQELSAAQKALSNRARKARDMRAEEIRPGMGRIDEHGGRLEIKIVHGYLACVLHVDEDILKLWGVEHLRTRTRPLEEST